MVARYTERSYRYSLRPCLTFLQLWLYFFQNLDQLPGRNNNGATSNRPPISETTPESSYADHRGRTAFDRLESEISSITGSLKGKNNEETDGSPYSRGGARPLAEMIRRQYRQHTGALQPSMPSISTSATSMPRPALTALSDSNVTSEEGMSDRGLRTSPPHTISFGISPSQLIGTPAREAARMITDDMLRTAGATSPPSSKASSSSAAAAKPQDKGKGRASAEQMNDFMADNDSSDKDHFEQFMKARQERLRQMGNGQELPTLRRVQRSPGGRSVYSDKGDLEGLRLANTPTMERVHAQYNEDLRPSKRQRSDNDSMALDIEVDDEDGWARRSVKDEFEFRARTPQEPSEHGDNNSYVGAYEFSQIIPRTAPTAEKRENSSLYSGESSNVSVTMMAGLTGQIPERFSLHYFPRAFQKPPGSTQLTRIYTIFADRPTQLLSLNDVIDIAQDASNSYNQDNVSILIDLLSRRHYLKKVGSGWTLRR